MEKKIIKGRDFLLFLPHEGRLSAVGCSTDCMLTLTHTPIPTASADGWPWDSAVRGRMTWGVHIPFYHHFSAGTDSGSGRDLLTLFDSLNTPLLMLFSTINSSELPRPNGGYYPDLRRARCGYVLPTEYEDNSPVDGLATGTLSLRGVGELFHKESDLRKLLPESMLPPIGNPDWDDAEDWQEGRIWKYLTP